MTVTLPTTGPASISNTVKSTDTPVTGTPSSSALGTGAAPLQSLRLQGIAGQLGMLRCAMNALDNEFL